jgi:alanyl-tRNA synthetase
VRKSLEEIREVRKSGQHLLEELTEFQAARLLSEAVPSNGRKLVVRVFADRDLTFIRLLAQKLTRLEENVVALLATTEQVALVFAQSKGMPFDMGALLKETLTALGGRGGGSKDMAQGGAPKSEGLAAALERVAARLRT